MPSADSGGPTRLAFPLSLCAFLADRSRLFPYPRLRDLRPAPHPYSEHRAVLGQGQPMNVNPGSRRAGIADEEMKL